MRNTSALQRVQIGSTSSSSSSAGPFGSGFGGGLTPRKANTLPRKGGSWLRRQLQTGAAQSAERSSHRSWGRGSRGADFMEASEKPFKSFEAPSSKGAGIVPTSPMGAGVVPSSSARFGMGRFGCEKMAPPSLSPTRKGSAKGPNSPIGQHSMVRPDVPASPTMLRPPTPPGEPSWVEFWDDESGAPYYVSASGETTWDRPAVLDAHNVAGAGGRQGGLKHSMI